MAKRRKGERVSRESDVTTSNVAGIVGLENWSFLRLAKVRVDSLFPADSPRLYGEDSEHIKRLAEIESGLPPILVQRGTMRVIDGMHRLRAAMLNGYRSIEVEFFDGDDEEAFIRAVEQNIAHGLPLPLADRKAAAARILGFRPALSDRSVASMTGLSPKTVGAIRACPSEEIPRLDAREGRDGRVRPLNSSDGRLRAAEAIRKKPGASLREVAASAGISPETVRSVKAQLRESSGDPAPGRRQRPGPTGKQPAESATGGAGAPATADVGAPDSRNGQPTDEMGEILQKLCRDPALRHSETGRKLLRMMHAKIFDGAALAVLMQDIPPHSRPLLARIARYNASNWKEVERELRRSSPAE